jgi:hypothetical protein
MSMGFIEILGDVTPTFAGVKMSNLKKGSRVTPPVDLNEKPQYSEPYSISLNQPSLP